VLFSTHVMTHAEEICEHVVMMHRGRKVLDEPVAAVCGRYDPRTIRLAPFDPGADLSGLTGLTEVERIGQANGMCEIVLREGTDPAAAMSRIALVVAPARIELARQRLEDVFVQIVTGAGAHADAVSRLRADVGAGDRVAAV
jgi:ABC-2 type transport system ATP-binding protein